MHYSSQSWVSPLPVWMNVWLSPYFIWMRHENESMKWSLTKLSLFVNCSTLDATWKFYSISSQPLLWVFSLKELKDVYFCDFKNWALRSEFVSPTVSTERVSKHDEEFEDLPFSLSRLFALLSSSFEACFLCDWKMTVDSTSPMFCVSLQKDDVSSLKTMSLFVRKYTPTTQSVIDGLKCPLKPEKATSKPLVQFSRWIETVPVHITSELLLLLQIPSLTSLPLFQSVPLMLILETACFLVVFVQHTIRFDNDIPPAKCVSLTTQISLVLVMLTMLFTCRHLLLPLLLLLVPKLCKFSWSLLFCHNHHVTTTATPFRFVEFSLS